MRSGEAGCVGAALFLLLFLTKRLLIPGFCLSAFLFFIDALQGT